MRCMREGRRGGAGTARLTSEGLCLTQPRFPTIVVVYEIYLSELSDLSVGWREAGLCDVQAWPDWGLWQV